MPETQSMIRWNMIRKAKNGLHYLDFVEFESGSSGAAIFEQVQRLQASPGSACGHKMWSALYSSVVYITTAVKGQASTQGTDIEAQTPIYEVFIKSQRYSEAYTLAIRNPVKFGREDSPNFLINRLQFATSGRPGQTIHALLVTQEIRPAKVSLLFVAFALLSVGIGVVAGLFSGDVNIGVGVTAGLFQFLTMLQWSYIWVARR